MQRLTYHKLLDWKKKKDRKLLILNGARQAGKTRLIKEFGSREYEDLAYINCDEAAAMKGVFSDFNTETYTGIFRHLRRCHKTAEDAHCFG